jgi:hypothetical protein
LNQKRRVWALLPSWDYDYFSIPTLAGTPFWK